MRRQPDWPCGICHGPLRLSERGYNTCDTHGCLGNVDAWGFDPGPPMSRNRLRLTRRAWCIIHWAAVFVSVVGFLLILTWTMFAYLSQPTVYVP